MHATIEQLIDFRDQQMLEATVKQHIESCNQCQDELEGLYLIRSQLQSIEAPEFDEASLNRVWTTISSALDQKDKTHVGSNHNWLAIACTVLIAVAAISYSVLDPTVPVEKTVSIEPIMNNTTLVTPSTDSDSGLNTRPSEFEQLLAYSQLLESQLQTMPQPRIVRADTVNTISQLEDQIALLDGRLSLQHQLPLTEQQRQALWQQRVNSMNNLYRVRSAQLQRVSY